MKNFNEIIKKRNVSFLLTISTTLLLTLIFTIILIATGNITMPIIVAIGIIFIAGIAISEYYQSQIEIAKEYKEDNRSLKSA